MPLYEYQCQECGLRFERRQSFSDEPVKTCPDCGGQVDRLIQAAGIIFKGSGFYVTDHRSKSPTAVAGSRKDDGENAAEKPPSEKAAKSESASAKTSSSEPGGGGDKKK